MKSDLEGFTNKSSDKELKKAELFRVRLSSRQIIAEKITNIITTRLQKFWIVISKRYTYIPRFYKDFVYY